jgi:predicted metal-dependent hydrolase
VPKIQLGKFEADLEYKDIKNVHLSVHPPLGRVRIAAPHRMKLDTIRVFAISKLGWIEQQRKKVLAQERESPRNYVERESHYVWGRRCLLALSELDEPPEVSLRHTKLLVQVRPGTAVKRRAELVEAWYRSQVKNAVPELISKWEKKLGVQVKKVNVRRMRTRWGSCNPASKGILLNTDLAKKPPECLEYIVVHEMIHLLEPTHNARFVALMDRYMPNWKHRKRMLNELPVRHEEWGY